MNCRAFALGALTMFAANAVAVASARPRRGGVPRRLRRRLAAAAPGRAGGGDRAGATAYDAAGSRAALLRLDRGLAAVVVAAAVAGPLVARGKPWPFVVAPAWWRSRRS
ncbi:MAG: hypothetical protein HS111_14735 [Kofleriaceae bacterium]|nr:hypothetical protein [Kofleriaceae bacterium]